MDKRISGNTPVTEVPPLEELSRVLVTSREPKEVPDLPEMKAGEIPELMTTLFAQLRDFGPKIRAPIPKGLTDGDALAIVERRSGITAKFEYALSAARTALHFGRSARCITYEDYSGMQRELDRILRDLGISG